MRRLLTLSLLAAFVVVLAGRLLPVPVSSLDEPATDASASGGVGTSAPPHDGTHWRQALTVTSAVTASPWRVQTLHAQLATLSVFVGSATAPTPAEVLAVPARPHGPPHSLNAPLRI